MPDAQAAAAPGTKKSSTRIFRPYGAFIGSSLAEAYRSRTYLRPLSLTLVLKTNEYYFPRFSSIFIILIIQ